jgi:malate dehydrogenase
MIAAGQVFDDTKVELRLLEIPVAVPALEGVKMELLDCAFPALSDVICTGDPLVAFQDADVAILVGGFPRKPGMLRKDLIQANTKIFLSMGQAINQVASADIKVLCVANPANTNCLVTLKQCAGRIPSKNFCAMTRLDYNRASAQIALKVDAEVADVKNVIIWGNHSATQYPDATTDGYVRNQWGGKIQLSDILKNDTHWLENTFLKTVQQRGKAIIDARGKSSAMSAANAAADCVRTWLVTGTEPGETVGMAVYNDKGYYGVRQGVMFSFPCMCVGGEWVVKEGLSLSSFARKKIKATEKELFDELDAAMEILAGSKL